MDRMNMLWIVGLVMIALSGRVCAQEEAVQKSAVTKPPEYEKVAEEYLKGVVESKSAPVAKVNGADITLYDLIERMNRIAPKYIAHGGELTPEIDQRVRQEALDSLIFRELAVQEAVRQGMKVPPEYVEETLKKIKANMGTEEAFKKYLDVTGGSEEALKKQIERDRLFKMIADIEIFQKAKAEGDKEHAVEKRKQEWEAELKKDAKLEMILGVKIKDEAGNPGKE